ncbi:hypothetical protein ACJJTC_005291 [Scirpophaga incertulas]
MPNMYLQSTKKGNTNAPVRAMDCEENNKNNVTFRGKTTKNENINHKDVTDDKGDISIIGDTFRYSTSRETELTLNNISQIIIEKLKENNDSIISQLQSTIQTEINKVILALKQELSSELENIKKQNTERKVDIEKLSSEIEYIKKENEKLRSKILELKDTDITQSSSNTDSNKSKIIIFGVEEIHGEPEYVVDYKKFKPRTAKSAGQVKPGLLWVIEQLPGYTEAADL